MAVDRAVLLGWVAPDAAHDAAEAAGLWSWGSVHLAGVTPQELHLF
jgi:hypothetical protein